MMVVALIGGGVLALDADAGRHLPVHQRAANLRGEQLRRHGPEPDRRHRHQRLRAELPVRRRPQGDRIEEHPELRPAQADLLSRHRHGGGHVAGRQPDEPCPRADAPQRAAALRDPLRRGQRAHRLPGDGEQDPAAGRVGRPGAVPHPPDADRGSAGHGGVFALRQQHAGDRHHGRSRPPPRPQLHARRRGFGPGDRERRRARRAICTPRAQTPLVPTNAMVADPQEMGKIPMQLGKDVYIRDVATDPGHHGHQLRLCAGQRPQVDLHPRGEEGHGLDAHRGPADPRHDAASSSRWCPRTSTSATSSTNRRRCGRPSRAWPRRGRSARR